MRVDATLLRKRMVEHQVEKTAMFKEAAQAADVVQRQLSEDAPLYAALGERLRALNPPFVVTCARGSSDHAATYAKYLIETLAHRLTASYAPSVSSVYEAPLAGLRGALFIVISQSGKSPDLIRAASHARGAGATVVALLNTPDAPIASIADIVVPLRAGAEHSVAATKSFIASLSALAMMVAHWTQDPVLHAQLAQLPQHLRSAWALDWTPAVDALRSARSLFVVGRGLGLGVAQEAALKLKETCALHAEALSAAEVRHGPMAIVERGFPVLLCVPQDETREGFTALAQDFVNRGARVLLAGAEVDGALALPIPQHLPAALAPIALAQTFYRFAAMLSLARGLNPDAPPHLSKVTQTL
jgi:glutamine---fructose-6-phosphate transaminase (isomerizing)